MAIKGVRIKASVKLFPRRFDTQAKKEVSRAGIEQVVSLRQEVHVIAHFKLIAQPELGVVRLRVVDVINIADQVCIRHGVKNDAAAELVVDNAQPVGELVVDPVGQDKIYDGELARCLPLADAKAVISILALDNVDVAAHSVGEPPDINAAGGAQVDLAESLKEAVGGRQGLFGLADRPLDIGLELRIGHNLVDPPVRLTQFFGQLLNIARRLVGRVDHVHEGRLELRVLDDLPDVLKYRLGFDQVL